MAFVEDFAPFYADFAVPCTVAGVEVCAVFDDATALGNVGISGMSTSQPVITVPTADIPANPEGASATVRGHAYVIAQAEHDGTGLTRLLLEAA